MGDLLYEVNDHIGLVTLNRPDAMNSLTYQLYADLEDTVRSSQARALVITGNGRAFCAGDDMKQILGSSKPAPSDFRDRAQKTGGLTPAADALLHTDIPVIAAVNGPAVGWGMELALMADIRVASKRARFGELFVLRGLCCDAPGLGRLAQLVGRERAAELLFSGPRSASRRFTVNCNGDSTKNCSKSPFGGSSSKIRSPSHNGARLARYRQMGN